MYVTVLWYIFFPSLEFIFSLWFIVNALNQSHNYNQILFLIIDFANININLKLCKKLEYYFKTDGAYKILCILVFLAGAGLKNIRNK